MAVPNPDINDGSVKKLNFKTTAEQKETEEKRKKHGSMIGEDYTNGIKKSFSELRYDKVVNNVLGFFKKENTQKKVSTSSALPNHIKQQSLTSRIFYDLYSNKEILLIKIVKKINILNIIYLRFLKEDDLEDVLDLHKELFPVNYHSDFYFSICNFDEQKLTVQQIRQIKEKTEFLLNSKKVPVKEQENVEKGHIQDKEKKNISSALLVKQTSPDGMNTDGMNTDEKNTYQQVIMPIQNDTPDTNVNANTNTNTNASASASTDAPTATKDDQKQKGTVSLNRKWPSDQIFSVGIFLPFPFIDYINSELLNELITEKGWENITEKDILLNYLQFIIHTKNKNKTTPANCETEETSTEELEKRDDTEEHKTLNKKNTNSKFREHENADPVYGVNPHQQPKKCEGIQMEKEKYKDNMKEKDNVREKGKDKYKHNKEQKKTYNTRNKKANEDSIEHNDVEKEMHTNVKEKKRKDYLIGSISVLINYGENKKQRDFHHINNFFTSQCNFYAKEKKGFTKVYDSSKQFWGNCFSGNNTEREREARGKWYSKETKGTKGTKGTNGKEKEKMEENIEDYIKQIKKRNSHKEKEADMDIGKRKKKSEKEMEKEMEMEIKAQREVELKTKIEREKEEEKTKSIHDDQYIVDPFYEKKYVFLKDEKHKVTEESEGTDNERIKKENKIGHSAHDMNKDNIYNLKRNEACRSIFFNEKHSLNNIMVLKKKYANSSFIFEKKIFEEIYMNKLIKESTKKYDKKKISSIYILTVGTHEYFRGLNLASFLIEYTIFYFYFIIYKLFLYRQRLYCYVDNEVFYSRGSNLKDTHNDAFEEGIISDTDADISDYETDSIEVTELLISDKESNKSNNVQKKKEQFFNIKPIDAKDPNSINLQMQKQVSTDETTEYNSTIKFPPQRNEDITTTITVKSTSSTIMDSNYKTLPLQRHTDINKGKNRRKKHIKNYSVCNSVIKHCYQKIIADDYLHSLYDMIHDEQCEEEAQRKIKKKYNFNFFAFQKVRKPLRGINIHDKIVHFFFNNFSAYYLKNRNLLSLHNNNNNNNNNIRKHIYNKKEREEQTPQLPLYIYLHVIEYNKAAINLYNKLNFYYICTFDNFYDINKISFSSFLYAYFF